MKVAKANPGVLSLEDAVTHDSVWHTAACDDEGGHPNCPGCMILCAIAAYEEHGRKLARVREIVQRLNNAKPAHADHSLTLAWSAIDEIEEAVSE